MKVIEDNRGSFQELAYGNKIIFGQLSYLTINTREVRGNHYHKRKYEWFCCIRGKCGLILYNVNTRKKKNLLLNENDKKFIIIKPYWNHIVSNIGNDENCEMLVIVSEKFNPKDTDTFVR